MTWLAQSWFPVAVYSLCFLTSVICAGLLLRSYLRVRSRVLFWTGLCFAFLAVNNLIVILDMFVILHTDLVLYRATASLLGVSTLLYGFVARGEGA